MASKEVQRLFERYFQIADEVVGHPESWDDWKDRNQATQAHMLAGHERFASPDAHYQVLVDLISHIFGRLVHVVPCPYGNDLTEDAVSEWISQCEAILPQVVEALDAEGQHVPARRAETDLLGLRALRACCDALVTGDAASAIVGTYLLGAIEASQPEARSLDSRTGERTRAHLQSISSRGGKGRAERVSKDHEEWWRTALGLKQHHPEWRLARIAREVQPLTHRDHDRQKPARSLNQVTKILRRLNKERGRPI